MYYIRPPTANLHFGQTDNFEFFPGDWRGRGVEGAATLRAQSGNATNTGHITHTLQPCDIGPLVAVWMARVSESGV
ncbi:hypothetical protein MSAN_01613300 [Mycena sanguinolenta]|uniref:Uncharacterized protein n=1 Tax=Mycena sanguinolenta TaxID=230812 RepID=A0A8H6Y0J1_9AGAR|nr:hypothetical protein MSAN_01613300 [Mycena sanguinolenta]